MWEGAECVGGGRMCGRGAECVGGGRMCGRGVECVGGGRMCGRGCINNYYYCCIRIIL